MKRTLAVLAVLAALTIPTLLASPAAAEDLPIGYRVTTQQVVGGRMPDGGAAPVALDHAGYLLSTSSAPRCSALVVRAISCGTTPAAAPISRTAGSSGLEVTNSPENAGSPKVKCLADPSDGGVGFGATNPGLVRSPGESIYFALDPTHTVICVCDTPATGLTATECVP